MIYEKYKKDIWALLGLGILFVLYCAVFWGRWGDVMVDCPRELYIPSQIAEGKGLYTGIFSLYSPLGYYLNAFFVKIFGNSLNLFYLLGCINTGIILFFIYLISRRFSGSLLSFSVSFLVLSYCCISFSPTTNYFFPYSYSVVYALTCFLASVYLLITYFNRDFKYKYILLCCLFAGLSISFKFEFALIFLPLIWVLFKKENGLKKIFYGILAVILPVILPFLVNIEGIRTFVDNFLAFCSSPSSKVFLKTISIKTPKAYIFSTFKDILFFLILFIPSFFLLLKSEKMTTKWKKIGAGLICALFLYGITSYVYGNRIYLFSWLTLVSLWFIIKYIIPRPLRERAGERGIPKEISDINLLTFILSLILLLSSFRVGGYLASNHYGKYYLPLFLVMFFCLYLPQILKKFEINYEKNISCILIIFSLFNLILTDRAVHQGKNYKIRTDKGKIFSSYPVGKTVEETALFIKLVSKPKDRVLVLPEGLMVNYLADRKSDDMLYQLLPNHIEIMGEDNIVERMNQNPAEYVVLSSLTTPSYGKTYFCTDYATKICDFINANYEHLETFENNQNKRSFMMMILRLKK